MLRASGMSTLLQNQSILLTKAKATSSLLGVNKRPFMKPPVSESTVSKDHSLVTFMFVQPFSLSDRASIMIGVLSLEGMQKSSRSFVYACNPTAAPPTITATVRPALTIVFTRSHAFQELRECSEPIAKGAEV